MGTVLNLYRVLLTRYGRQMTREPMPDRATYATVDIPALSEADMRMLPVGREFLIDYPHGAKARAYLFDELQGVWLARRDFGHGNTGNEYPITHLGEGVFYAHIDGHKPKDVFADAVWDAIGP